MQQFRKSIYRQSNNILTFVFNFSIGQKSVGLACQEITFPITLYSIDSVLIVGSVLYNNNDLTGTFNGANMWYKLGTKSYKINNLGIIVEISVLCSTLLPLTKYCFIGIFDDDDVIHVPPGGIVQWEDEFGDPQMKTGLTSTTGVYTVYSSIVPTTNPGATDVECD